MRDSFNFYRSFAESLKEVDEETRDKVLMAIFDYVFDDIEPTELDGTARAMFTLMRSQLEESIDESDGEDDE